MIKLLQYFAVVLTFLNNTYFIYAKKYDNYTIYNLYPKNEEQLKFLENLDRIKFLDIIFPDMPPENEVLQVLVNEAIEDIFLTQANHYKLSLRKLADNAQKIFDSILAKSSSFHPRSELEVIRSLRDVYLWLNNTAANHTGYTTLESIGKSAEGRDILAFSIHISPRPNYSNLKAIIEAAIHGNEWITTAASLYMIDEILNATTGPYALLKKKYFLYFIPILNPDGYEYSQKEDPLWRKNRREIGGNKSIYGVNLNRNFEYNFGGPDSSDDPTSKNYRGPYPFSEPETAALMKFMQRKHNQVAFYFALHGHGQKFIIPYSDSLKHYSNYHEVQGFLKRAALKIMNQTNTVFRVGTASEILGRSYSGDSASWMKKIYHFPYTLTIQLRDNGEKGITLPNYDIEPACAEISEGLSSFMLATGSYRPYVDRAHSSNELQYIAFLIFIALTMF